MQFSDYQDNEEVRVKYQKIVTDRLGVHPRFLARVMIGNSPQIQMCDEPEEVIAFFGKWLAKAPSSFQIEDRLRNLHSGRLLKNRTFDEQLFRDFMAEATVDAAAKEEFLKALRQTDLDVDAAKLAATQAK